MIFTEETVEVEGKPQTVITGEFRLRNSVATQILIEELPPEDQEQVRNNCHRLLTDWAGNRIFGPKQ